MTALVAACITCSLTGSVTLFEFPPPDLWEAGNSEEDILFSDDVFTDVEVSKLKLKMEPRPFQPIAVES